MEEIEKEIQKILERVKAELGPDATVEAKIEKILKETTKGRCTLCRG